MYSLRASHPHAGGTRSLTRARSRNAKPVPAARRRRGTPWSSKKRGPGAAEEDPCAQSAEKTQAWLEPKRSEPGGPMLRHWHGSRYIVHSMILGSRQTAKENLDVGAWRPSTEGLWLWTMRFSTLAVQSSRARVGCIYIGCT